MVLNKVIDLGISKLILIENGFFRGKIYITLFRKTINSELLVVQVYVDDIIFGSTKEKMCEDFSNLM